MRPLFTRVYSDDTLILTTIVDRHTRHAAFEHVLEELYLELTGDLGRYKLGGLGYSATSRVAADCLIPFLADILQRFAHAADLKARRNAITADKLVEVACYSISLDTEAASTVPAKPVPYSERIVLPPVIIPIARHGPKIKTRGNTTLIELPAPVPAADDIPPKLYEVPGTIYAILERIFLPKSKGRVTFKDLQRVMTCKAIGFSYKHKNGCRGHFEPPPDAGLKPITLHEEHGGKEFKVNYARKTLYAEYGWTMDRFVRVG